MSRMSFRRLRQVASVVLPALVWGHQAPAQPFRVIELHDSFLADTGTYREGEFGPALAVTGNLSYPVLYAQKEVKEGTVSVWFKPRRRPWYGYDHWPLVRLGDGERKIEMVVSSKPSCDTETALPPRRLGVQAPGGLSRTLADQDLDRYHHVLYTWDEKAARSYWNGEPLGQAAAIQGKPWVGVFDGARVQFDLGTGPGGFWVDEVVVLDRCLSEAEAQESFRKHVPHTVDGHTVLQLDFDGSPVGKAALRADGATIRWMERVGHPDATFRADDPARIEFTVANTLPQPLAFRLRGEVRNLDRKTVLEKVYAAAAGPGEAKSVVFDLGEIREKGLFWGRFTLTDSQDQVLGTKVVPFALTLGVDVAKHPAAAIPNGIVMSSGLNPPCHEKWAQIKTVLWRDVESAPGQWDFSELDLQVEEILRTGRRPQMCLFGTPEWLAQQVKPGKRWWAMPQDLNAYKEYVRRLGERYKGKLLDYEVWNEPYWNDPAGGYFYGTAEEYATLVNATAEVLHAIDPRIRVCCGMGGSASWQETVATATAGKADYYGTHPYAFAELTGADEDILAPIRDLLQKTKASPRIANTEVGYASLMAMALDEDGYPMTAADFDRSGRWERAGKYFHDQGREYFYDHYQCAALVTRTCLLSLASGCEYVLWWSGDSGSVGAIANLIFKRNTPSLPSVAYTNLTGILCGAKFIKRLDLGPDTLKAYLFRRQDGVLLAAWAGVEPETAFIEVGDGPVQAMDLLGRDVAVERFGPVASLKLTYSPVFLTGLAAVPEKSVPILKMASVQDFVFPGQDCQVRVTVHNPLPQGLRVGLALALPADFAAPAPQQVTVAPKQTVEALFELKVPAQVGGSQKMDIVFTSDVPALARIQQSGVLAVRQAATVRRVAHPIKADGDLSEWGSLEDFPVRIDRPGQVVVGIPCTQGIYIPKVDWTGPADLSARAALAYDDSALYVAVRVYDNIVMNPFAEKKPFLAYEGDCIELFLDARPPAAQGTPPYSKDVYQLLLSPPVEGFPAPLLHIGQPNQGRLAGVAYNITRQQDGYSLELSVPWSNFPGLTRQAGANFGFDLAIDDKDDDGKPGRKSQMVWAGSARDSGDASLFGRIAFSP